MNKSKKAVNKNSLKDFDFDQYLKLKKAERVKLLQQMVENLDPESRKKFFRGLLPYVLSDDNLTREAFKHNSGRQYTKKSKVFEITSREREMISQIADYFHELELIVDLDELLYNP